MNNGHPHPRNGFAGIGQSTLPGSTGLDDEAAALEEQLQEEDPSDGDESSYHGGARDRDGAAAAEDDTIPDSERDADEDDGSFPPIHGARGLPN